MDVKILSTFKHRGVRVVVRQIDELFEYLYPLDGQVYANFVIFKKEKGKRGGRKPYTEQQLGHAAQVMEGAARESIDFLKRSFLQKVKEYFYKPQTQ